MNHSVYFSSVSLASFNSVSQQHFPYDVIFLSNCSVLPLGHITGIHWSKNTVEFVMEIEKTEWAEDCRPVAISGYQSAPFPQ
jgi:hypothetical protein